MKDLTGRDANILKITGGGNSQQNISKSLFRQGNRMPLLHLCYAIALTLRRGSSALAHTLRYPCATLALLLLFTAVEEVQAVNRTFDGETYIYYNIKPASTSWWNNKDNNICYHYIKLHSSVNNSWSSWVQVSTNDNGAFGCYLVPEGTYDKLQVGRGNGLSDGNPNWNTTSDIEFDASYNYLSDFSHGGSPSPTWSDMTFYISGANFNEGCDGECWNSKRVQMNYYSSGDFWYKQVSYTNSVSYTDDYRFKITLGSTGWDHFWNIFDNSKGDITLSDDGTNDHNVTTTTKTNLYLCFTPQDGMWATSTDPTLSGISVTYNGNGATGGSVPTDGDSYEENDEVTILGNTGSLEKTGYEFAGWTDNSAGTGTVYTADDTYTITGNTTFYAKWVRPSTFRVYIEGRMSCRSVLNGALDKHVGGSLGTWSTSSTHVELTRNSTSSLYELQTYCTIAELSQTTNGTQYLRIGESDNNGSSITRIYGKSGDPTFTAVNNSYTLIEDENGSVYFNSPSDNNGYVVITYNAETKVIGYYIDEDKAKIASIDLSTTRIPPMASITATPSMTRKGTGDKAYCWKLFSDAACTAEVAASIASVGDGAVSFLAPATRDTYYLRLQVHSDDGCASTLDDEEVVSFEVTTTDMVFFRNVPNWGSVHVYFLGTTSYWNDNDGSGCVGRDNGIAHGMTRIPNTNIYYYDYYGNSNVANPSGAAYIAFTDNYLPNADHFSGCQAVYRADFSTCAPMYVPENYISEYKNTSARNGQAAYYNRGYWTNYMSTASGFTLHIYAGKDKYADDQIISQDLTAASIGDNTYSFTYNFASADKTVPYTYGFEVSGCGGAWYAVDADMNINNCTNWNLFTGTTRRGGVDINANVAHTFVLTLTRDGHIQLSVDYPPAEGDYRLLYDDNTQAPHPSQVIRKRADGKDTVAMYIRPSAAGSTLKVQSVSLSPSITWSDYAPIDISGLRDSVYLFYLEQDADGALTVKTTETKPYVGPYYIRTQSVDGGWDSYRNSPDNLMTYSQWSADQGYGFNYYKTKWVSPAGSFVTFTIACDYSEALCDTMFADPVNQPLSAEQAENLPQAANIRFGWSSHTNLLTRAYISGSSNVSDRFLVLQGDSKMKDKDGNALISGAAKVAGLDDYEMNFADLGNWIYRADIKAEPGAQVSLTADYNGRTQYFIGTDETPETIIGGSTGEPQPMRVTYDFKTNRLTTAWLPNGERIDDDITLKADMMLIRKGQEAATQITFASGKKIEEIKSIYGVMEFKKSEIAGQFPNWSAPNAYAYLMYYVSFPFDVRVRDIFGAGVMGENWIIQKYNGAKRAEIGWFAETSTFWETLPVDSILHKHEGYLLLLDRISFNDESSDLWYKIPSDGSIYLYFPSASHSIGTISDKDQPITVPSHVCSINRTFTVDGVAGTLSHKNTDSHWNVIGTPLFATANAFTVGSPVADGNGETALQYYYAWNSSNNTLDARATFGTGVTFKSMHGYMVQYAGVVTFHGAAITPASVVARRRVQVEPNYCVELQLVSEENRTSHTYVELRENACDTFALNEDMYMMRSSKTVDLYSFAGAYDVAANVLSLSDHTVPLGLDVKRAGTYRFTMPSSFSGTVTLLDKTTGTRTNLALGDYEVWLDRGMVNNRFELVLSVSQITTAIDAVGDPANGQGCKYLQDGQLYILKEGVVYDARGTRVK